MTQYQRPMDSFKEFNLSRQLQNAIDEMGFERPTPVQVEAYPIARSGKNLVGIAQTGTGKTLAYLLPLLMDYKYSRDMHPRYLVLVPTRELVDQVVQQIEKLTEYITIRVMGIYGGVNINTQRQRYLQEGANIVVATPGRFYDLLLSQTIKVKGVKKLVIDEVDVMLDLGFRHQLTNLMDLLPTKRQNVMFSATMTEKVDEFINDFFILPERVQIAVSGTPLDNIAQQCYPVPNFYTKANLLKHLVKDKDAFGKVLVFVSSKKKADRLFLVMEERFGSAVGVIHANKSQNFRTRSIEEFDQGMTRILITTDVMARGLDLDRITHVFNYDVPIFPENYMHRIGRTGRAEEEGTAIMFFTEKEEVYKASIEALMDYKIPQNEFPEAVEVSEELTREERPDDPDLVNQIRDPKKDNRGAAFHEKKDKNKKVNLGGGKRKKELKLKYKKPKTRGDKRKKKR